MSDGTATFNTRGLPSRVCLSCTGTVFKILAQFDEDGSIAWHTLNGYCAGCHAPITVPTPDYVATAEVDFDDDYFD